MKYADLPVTINAECPPDRFYIVDAAAVFPSAKSAHLANEEDVRKAVARMLLNGAQT